MSDIDFERAFHLLQIVHLSVGASGKLMALSGAAMDELLVMNDQARQVSMAKKKQDELDAGYKAAQEQKQIEPEPEVDEDGVLRPTIHPADSRTATIADNNIPIVERRV